MTLRRYTTYKNSGVEWLGDVPAHWDVAAVSYRYEVLLGKMLDEKRITGNHLAPYLRNVDVQWDQINVDELPQMDFSGDDLARYCLTPGDLLVCEGGEVGRAAIWRGQLDECYYQKAIHRLRQRVPDSDHARFMFYVLRMATTRGVFEASEAKSTIAHLTAEALRRYRFAFPSRAEQEGIATYLDGEAAKIDTLIAEQQRLIELLTEKRQAVIAQAVTKGLNAAAPMKDSGVEWLGDVPAHWTVFQLGRISTARCDGPFGSGLKSEHYVDSGVRVIRLQNIRADGFNADSTAYIDPHYYRENLGDHDVVAGDVLLAGLGDDRNTVGRACVAPDDIAPAMVKADCFRFRLDRKIALPLFVASVLNVSAQADAGRLAGGSTRSRIPLSVMASRHVALPPLDEQADIAAMLATAVDQLETLCAEAEHAIALLQERRTALISAAVTGQIDVRPTAALEAALAESAADIAAGRYAVESAAAHVARLQVMASANEQSAPPPASC